MRASISVAGGLACLLFTLSAEAKARPAKAGLAEPVKLTSVEGITEYRLENGLHVLLYPDQSKPEITTNITYMVGSRYENYGETGMAHLLEHLLFKGTDRHPDVPKVLNSLGARFNGSTWFDRTNYFVSFPASEANLTAALELESDRMVNSHIWKSDLWNEKEKRGEMSVVRNEMESGENDPVGVTNQRLQSIAYDWHNYGKDTIGARSDVENVNIQHLKAFYRRYYQPDNAYLMIAGKIDEAKVLAQVNRLFGSIPRPARTLEKGWTVEPTQDGERQVTVRRVGGTPYLAIGYHIPQSANPDADASVLLSYILTTAPSGRLYQALVQTKLAARVSTSTVSSAEPGFLQFGIELPNDGDVEAARTAALAVLEGLKDKPITAEELERARAEQIRLYDALAQHTDRLATEISEAMAAGDWRLFFVSRDRLEAMTLAPVQAAAEKYFQASNRTTAIYVPTDKPQRAEMPAPVDIAAMVNGYKGRAPVAEGEQFDPTPKNIEARLLRFGSTDGLQGALMPKQTKGFAVSFEMTLRFGSESGLMNLGAVPGLVGPMLLRGSTTHTREQIKDAFDRMKTQVQINSAADSVHVSMTSDKEHFSAALDLLAEVLKTPAFPAAELATLRADNLAQLEENRSEPQAIAFNAVQLATTPYPEGHPMAARSIDQSIAELKAAKLEEIKAFHSVFYGADHGELAAVGDFDAQAVQAQITRLFSGWHSTQPYARIVARAWLTKPLNQELPTPDKANAFFVAVHPVALRDSDPDFAALLLGDQIVGGGALKSRLADRIRQKEGISYGIGSNLQANSLDPASLWLAYAIYAPQNVGRLDAAFQEELQRARDTGFTSDELAFSKNAWLQGRQVSRTQDGELARRLAAHLRAGRTMAFDEAREKEVAATTLDQVNAAYRKYLDAASMTVVKAGDFKKPTASVDVK